MHITRPKIMEADPWVPTKCYYQIGRVGGPFGLAFDDAFYDCTAQDKKMFASFLFIDKYFFFPVAVVGMSCRA